MRAMNAGYLLSPIDKPSSKTPAVLSKLIDNELSESFLNVPYKSDVPYYVSCLFHRFLHCGKEVFINHYNMGQHEAYEDPYFGMLYGFKSFQSIFKYPDLSMYNLSLFFRLFPNLEKMVVFNYVKCEWKESIPINGVFLEEILKCMDILDETVNDTFSEFVVVNPTDSIEKFRQKNWDRLKARGWSMMEGPYSHPRRPGKGIKALYIQRDQQ